MSIRVQTKIYLSLMFLGVFGYICWMIVDMFSPLPSDLINWVVFVISILLLILLNFLIGYVFISFWKRVPTITKKNKEQVAKWLSELGYQLCDEPAKLVCQKSFVYPLISDGFIDEPEEVKEREDVVILNPSGKLTFMICRKGRVSLFDNYSYLPLNNRYLALFHEYGRHRMQIYKKTL